MALGVLGSPITLNAQAISYDTLLARSSGAIVQIVQVEASSKPAAGQKPYLLKGTGFVVSSDGLLLTCNHVVATVNSTSGQWKYLEDIAVIFQDGTREDATVLGHIGFERISRDYAVLQVNRKNLNYLSLGPLSDAKVGDDLIAWGFPFGIPGPVLIKGSVAAKLSETVEVGPEKKVVVHAVVFQGPTNRGMSGGPLILNRTGEAIGIVSNRIAGIGKQLVATGKHITSTQRSGSVTLMGVDPNVAILELIKTLDKYLMSGMGVAIAVDHVRPELKQAKVQ